MKQEFENFVETSRKSLYRNAYHLSQNVDEAKDLVQETMFRVLRSWKLYDPSKRVEPWAMAIMRNRHIESRRRYEHKHVVSLDAGIEGADDLTYEDVLSDGRDAVLDFVERKETVDAVRSAIAGLKRQHRDVLIMRDLEGRPYEEMAQSIGIPINTLRSRLSRARNAMRSSLSGSNQLIARYEEKQ